VKEGDKTITAKIEHCENCGNVIERLEEAFVHDEHIVCEKCYEKLKNRATPQAVAKSQSAKVIDTTQMGQPRCRERKTMRKTHWILVVFVAVCLGFLFGFIVSHRSNAKVRNLEAQLRNKELKLKNDEVAVERSKKEAEEIIKNAKKEAEGYILRGKNELFKLYPNLKEYKPGSNVVNEKYINSIYVNGNEIKIEMHNTTRDNIGPNADIIFLNKQGFVTENYKLFWFFSSIKPGETRFDEGNVKFNYGEPVYYSVEFDD
jgi:superfamily II DNA helicase RecQ